MLKKWKFWIVGGLGVCLIAGGVLYRSLYYSSVAVSWEEYKPYKLSLAKERHQPVVIDFYADWCPTCHDLETFVFKHKEVIEKLNPFVRLRVDATDMESSEAQMAIEKFDVPGLPVIVFLNGNGQEVSEARVTGFVSVPEFFKSVEAFSKSLVTGRVPQGAGPGLKTNQ